MIEENQHDLDLEEYQKTKKYWERLNKKAGIRIFIYVMGIIMSLVYVSALFPISFLFLVIFPIYIWHWATTFKESMVKIEELKSICPVE